MTLIVGILCSDGVVMASDSAAMYSTGFAPTIGQQEVTKVVRISDAILYSSTGAIGVAQLICNHIEKLWNGKALSGLGAGDAMEKLAAEIRGCVYPLLQAASASVNLVGQNANMTAVCKSLVALPCKKAPCLFQFDHAGAPEQATKELPFVALGSGQQIADPFLAFLKRVLWKASAPTVAEGRFVAAWTITHVAQTNPGGVALPLQLASLTMPSGTPKIEIVDDTGEHEQAIVDAEAAPREHVRGRVAPAPVPTPT